MPAVTVRVRLSSGRKRAPFCFMDQISRIIRLEREGSKFGLERISELLRRAGHPDERLKIVHVAGSNGKGSVCAYISQILCAAGKKTGTFTSPQVYCYEQKFCIDCNIPPRELVNKYLFAASNAAEGMADAPTAFELETCAALLMFSGEGCEYAVIECGLGGLYDSTNAVAKKQVAAITSISLEHTAVLGGTIGDICRHKGGIIKDCPAVVPANLCAEAAEYFAARGAAVAGRNMRILRSSPRGQSFECDEGAFCIGLTGVEQAYNAAVAARCAMLLGIAARAIARGLKNTSGPGRVQKIAAGGRMYILDGAHNPAAFSPLVQALGKMRGGKSLVFTCLSDKDVASAAALIGGYFKEVIIVPAPSVRAMDTGAIEREFKKYCNNVCLCGSIPQAMERASEKTVVACGSFTHLSEVKDWIEKKR